MPEQLFVVYVLPVSCTLQVLADFVYFFNLQLVCCVSGCMSVFDILYQQFIGV